MSFEEAFDYIRSLSSLNEERIKEILNERSQEPDQEFILSDEDSGTSFHIRFTQTDGFTIDAVF